MALSWKGITSAHLRVLKDDIAGLQPVSTDRKALEALSGQQIMRLVELRKIIVQYRVPTSEHGKFAFTLDTLKALDVFAGGESNQIQKVAYRNRITKIKDDLVLMRTMQDDLNELIQSGASENAVEVARDEIEDKGREVTRAYLSLINVLQEDIKTRRGLSAASMYRASLTNERKMYVTLEKEGTAMRRKWNDVRLEVRDLLSATNHDAKAKVNLERMLKDLNTILAYLDEYALFPFLAPRDIIAQIVLIDRRLNDYQDEYDLSQSDTERIANVIDDRQTRDEIRAKIAEKTMNFFNALGISKNVSVGGLYRGTRAVLRGIHRTARFLTRTAPSLARSGWTAVRTTPQRIKQTALQFGRGITGAARAVGGLFGLKSRKKTGVDWDSPFSQDALAATISAGYGKGAETPGAPVPMMPDTGSGPSTSGPDDFLTPEGEEVHDEMVQETSRTPGATSTQTRAQQEMENDSLSKRLDYVDFKLDQIIRQLNSGTSTVVNVTQTGAAGEGGELASLQRSEELDLLKSISASLERVAARMSKEDEPPKKAGLLDFLLSKMMSIKSWVGKGLAAIGSLFSLTKAFSVIKGAVSLVARMGAPLLRLGGFAARILTGPIGMLLGAGTAGWQIGKALYEQFSVQILDGIEAVVGGVQASIDFVKSGIDKVYSIVSGLGEAWDRFLGRNAKHAEKTKAEGLEKAIQADMKNYKGLSPETVARAKKQGADISKYPIWDSKSGKVLPPGTVPAPSAPISPQTSEAPRPASPTPSSTPPVSRSSGKGVVQDFAIGAGPRVVSNSSMSSPRSSPVTSSMGGVPATEPAVSGKLYNAAAGANMDGLQPSVRTNFEAMVSEYKSRGGKHPVNVNRAFATHEQQAALFAKYGPGRAARPGNSAHNYGVAIDIDRAAANDMASMGLLDKYGFDRPVAGEPWHLQVKGVTAAMAKKGIYSADSPSKQGGGDEEAVASRGASQNAPSVMSAQPSSESPETRVQRENGLPAETAAYSPKQAPAAAKSESSQKAQVPGVDVATPAGHGVSRIPEFSYGDPTFFALNLGALAS